MDTKTPARAALSKVVASNVRAEAARRGLTQAAMGRALGMAPPVMNDRYRERVPWTVDELGRVAELFGLEVGDLLARPKGFEPLTFWLGADHTVTALDGGLFCDGCGPLYPAREDSSVGDVTASHAYWGHDDADVERAA